MRAFGSWSSKSSPTTLIALGTPSATATLARATLHWHWVPLTQPQSAVLSCLISTGVISMTAPGVRCDRPPFEHLCRETVFCRDACSHRPRSVTQVDHGKPKTDTMHNPSSDVLVDWLRQISSWSNMHPTHSPITVGLDIKPPFDPSGAPPLPPPLYADAQAVC